MIKVGNYLPGANLTVMNVMYQKPRKSEDGKTFYPDKAYIVYKDNETGKKYVENITTPQYTYYKAKDGIKVGFCREWIEKDKVVPVTCNYRDIKKSIAIEVNDLKTYNENIKTGNYQCNDAFFAHPRIFSADMNILNYLRMEFADTYQNPVCDISVAYYDIENDIIDSLSDEVVIGENPINMASIYFDKTKTLYSFILRNNRNPQIEEFEKDIKKNFKKYVKKVNDFISSNIGSMEKTKKYKLDNLNLSVGFFDTEAELIGSFFMVTKQLSPDFAVAYNSSYDLPYLMARGEMHGLDMIKLISDDDFDSQFYYYFIDRECYNDYAERKDYVQVSSKTVWLDQMIIYPSRRKGQNAISSFSLDNVANHECKVKKLDWHHITDQFKYFVYKDFVNFWLYNLNDTIVQACLEAQTEDLRYVFNNVIEMNTPYQKIFRQTNYLASKGMEFYKNHEGVIMGNNINRFGKKPEEKFPGAFVAKPTKLTDKYKYKANGYAIMKFANGDDFDYKALYPSLMREFNMSISTQIGMIQIDAEKSPFKPIDYLRLGAGGHFAEDVASYNFIQFAHRWIQLPDIEEMVDAVENYYTTMRTPQYKMNSIHNTLPMDTSHRSVMGFVDRHSPLNLTPPIPEWVKNEVDIIRKGIQIA